MILLWLYFERLLFSITNKKKNYEFPIMKRNHEEHKLSIIFNWNKNTIKHSLTLSSQRAFLYAILKSHWVNKRWWKHNFFFYFNIFRNKIKHTSHWFWQFIKLLAKILHSKNEKLFKFIFTATSILLLTLHVWTWLFCLYLLLWWELVLINNW